MLSDDTFCSNQVSKKTAIEAKADVPGEKLMSSPESEDEPVTNIDEDDDDEDISLANFARARKSNNNKMTKSKGVEVKDKAVVVSDDDDEDVPIAKLSRASSAKGKKLPIRGHKLVHHLQKLSVHLSSLMQTRGFARLSRRRKLIECVTHEHWGI